MSSGSSMQGKVCVITGATSGIGLVAAGSSGGDGRAARARRARPGRGEAALAAVQARAPGAATSHPSTPISRGSPR